MSDYFSAQSKVYSKSRPTYPPILFKYLAALCRKRELAWDAATGNGQCARELSKYFKTVVATDLSTNQLGNALQKENITYRHERAEDCSLENESVDLITVATAIHWFDIPVFYKQAHRVLKNGGVLAVWSYAGCRVSKQIDVVLDHFAFELMKNYWPKETTLNWKERYRTLPFPYKQMELPPFEIKINYNLYELINYLGSWSSTQRYKEQHSTDPVLLIKDELQKLWGNPDEPKTITWELFMKCGRK